MSHYVDCERCGATVNQEERNRGHHVCDPDMVREFAASELVGKIVAWLRNDVGEGPGAATALDIADALEDGSWRGGT